MLKSLNPKILLFSILVFGACLFLSKALFLWDVNLFALDSDCGPCVRTIPYPNGQGNCNGTAGPRLLISWADSLQNNGHDGKCGETTGCDWIQCEWRGYIYAANQDTEIGYANITIKGPRNPANCFHVLRGNSCSKPFGLNGNPPIVASCTDDKPITIEGTDGGTEQCSVTLTFRCGACPAGQN